MRLTGLRRAFDTIDRFGSPMAAGFTSGLIEENLVGSGEPYVVRHGRERAVTGPFEDAGGTVAVVDLAEIRTDTDFLRALHSVLPLPYGGLKSWDTFRDSYEEIAESIPRELMLVLRGIDELLAADITLALRLSGQLIESRHGIGEFGRLFLPVFVVTACSPD